MIPLTFALVAVLWVTAAQGQSNLPPGLFTSSDRAQELIQGPSIDTLDPRVDTMHVFTRVDVMPAPGVSLPPACGNTSLPPDQMEPECLTRTKVYLRFIVERDGSTTSPSVVKGACPTLDRLALQQLAGMPPWKPGQVEGVPVRVQMVMPIQFDPR